MLSVVVPAFNEEKNIGKCLDALIHQDVKEKYEIIIVNNKSTDKTVKVIKSYQRKFPIQLIHEDKKGRSPARKAGFNIAKGRIIFSTDADTVVPNNWISKMLREFDGTDTIAVSGTWKIIDNLWYMNWFLSHIQPLLKHLYRFVFGHYGLLGFNFAIKKSVYDKSGGFDSDLNVQEDTDLAFKVSKIGRIKHCGNCSVIVSGRRFKGNFIINTWPYLTSFINYLYFRRVNKVYLSDTR